MELSKSTQEVITQAQMLRLETGAESLCLEHVYYGLLLMASYLDAPMNAEEYRKEAKELRKYLETKNRSIASAKHQLSRDAKEDSSLFVDARRAGSSTRCCIRRRKWREAGRLHRWIWPKRSRRIPARLSGR